MNAETEEWRLVVGRPDYEVSSIGRVRRVTPARGTRAGFILKLMPHNAGYSTVVLSTKSRTKKVLVHQLVCEAFHGPRPSPIHEVAHGDGVRRHNSKDNVRWATPKENAADKIAHGTTRSGSRHGMAVLNETDVRMIRASRFIQSDAGLAAAFQVSRATISLIRREKLWRHIL